MCILSETTIVSASKNRESYLLDSLLTWMPYPFASILICDFNDTPSTHDFLLSKLGRLPNNIKVLHFGNPKTPWVLSWAYNAIFEHVSSKYILKLDSDDSILPQFTQFADTLTSTCAAVNDDANMDSIR